MATLKQVIASHGNKAIKKYGEELHADSFSFVASEDDTEAFDKAVKEATDYRKWQQATSEGQTVRSLAYDMLDEYIESRL